MVNEKVETQQCFVKVLMIYLICLGGNFARIEYVCLDMNKITRNKYV